MRDPKVRAAGVILGLPVMVAAVIAIAFALHSLRVSTGVGVPVALVPVLVYGWLANRWWAAFPLPIIVGAIYLAVRRVIDLETGGCSICGGDEDWSNYPYWFAFTAVLPATVLVFLGVGVRRASDLYREWRREKRCVLFTK
jgi:hypothetical protein